MSDILECYMKLQSGFKGGKVMSAVAENMFHKWVLYSGNSNSFILMLTNSEIYCMTHI